MSTSVAFFAAYHSISPDWQSLLQRFFADLLSDGFRVQMSGCLGEKRWTSPCLAGDDSWDPSQARQDSWKVLTPQMSPSVMSNEMRLHLWLDLRQRALCLGMRSSMPSCQGVTPFLVHILFPFRFCWKSHLIPLMSPLAYPMLLNVSEGLVKYYQTRVLNEWMEWCEDSWANGTRKLTKQSCRPEPFLRNITKLRHMQTSYLLNTFEIAFRESWSASHLFLKMSLSGLASSTNSRLHSRKQEAHAPPLAVTEHPTKRKGQEASLQQLSQLWSKPHMVVTCWQDLTSNIALNCSHRMSTLICCIKCIPWYHGFQWFSSFFLTLAELAVLRTAYGNIGRRLLKQSDVDERSALCLAIMGRNSNIIQILLKAKARCHENKASKWMTGRQVDSMKRETHETKRKIVFLWSKGCLFVFFKFCEAEIEAVDIHGNGLLHYACMSRDREAPKISLSSNLPMLWERKRVVLKESFEKKNVLQEILATKRRTN